MPLTNDTRAAIRTYLEREVRRYIRQTLEAGRVKPFHDRLMPPLAEVPYSERSFSTRLGTWFEIIALNVARQFHPFAVRNHLVQGRIRPAAEAALTAILEDLDQGRPRRRPNRETDIQEVLGVQGPGGADRQVRSDLFVRKADGMELYFEMKTPDPNKGQCKTMKQNILLISALRQENLAAAFGAAAYNPFGEGNAYRNRYAPQFLDVGRDLLIGSSFWRTIGDEFTYEEVLVVAEEVGRATEQDRNRVP